MPPTLQELAGPEVGARTKRTYLRDGLAISGDGQPLARRDAVEDLGWMGSQLEIGDLSH